MRCRPPERRGTVTEGRILKLFVGHGYGFIRLANSREVYFHRADVHTGTSINEFRVDELVAFGLLDDRVSGPRALRLRRCSPEGGRRHD